MLFSFEDGEKYLRLRGTPFLMLDFNITKNLARLDIIESSWQDDHADYPEGEELIRNVIEIYAWEIEGFN